MTVLSKIPVPTTGTIPTTCVEYVHPWTNSCLQAVCGLYLYAIFDSLRIYGTVYMVRMAFTYIIRIILFEALNIQFKYSIDHTQYKETYKTLHFDLLINSCFLFKSRVCST